LQLKWSIPWHGNHSLYWNCCFTSPVQYQVFTYNSLLSTCCDIYGEWYAVNVISHYCVVSILSLCMVRLYYICVSAASSENGLFLIIVMLYTVGRKLNLPLKYVNDWGKRLIKHVYNCFRLSFVTTDMLFVKSHDSSNSELHKLHWITHKVLWIYICIFM